MLGVLKNEPVIFISNIEENKIILSEYKNGISLPNETDILTILSGTKNRISLKSEFSKSIMSLERINSNIVEVDSLNLEKWKQNTLKEFNNRAKSENCPDLRTEEEKIIHNLGIVEFPDEEEISINNVKK